MTVFKFAEELDKLQNRVPDSVIFSEFFMLGPQALPELFALNRLSDEDLEKYLILDRQKRKIARQCSTQAIEFHVTNVVNELVNNSLRINGDEFINRLKANVEKLH